MDRRALVRGDRLDDCSGDGRCECALRARAAIPAVTQQADLVLHLDGDHGPIGVHLADVAQQRRERARVGVARCHPERRDLLDPRPV